jgi:hypothetical protein
MSSTANALRELHRIHRQLTDLRSRLERGPKQIKGGEANVQKLAAELEQVKEAFKKARIQSDEKQLQLRAREDRLAQIKVKLNAASSNREYQAFLEQIAADKQANSVLSDEILEGLEEIEELQAKLNAAETKLQRAKTELEKVRNRVSSERDGLESELARVTNELKLAETNLPGDFKANYQRIARLRGEDALAPVDGETCGSCFQMITPQMMNDLMMSKPVFCKSCGCLLYLPEDTSPSG